MLDYVGYFWEIGHKVGAGTIDCRSSDVSLFSKSLANKIKNHVALITKPLVV